VVGVTPAWAATSLMVAMSGFDSLACEWMSGFSLKLVSRSTSIIEHWFNVKARRENIYRVT
jgi:hypothetical protein